MDPRGIARPLLSSARPLADAALLVASARLALSQGEDAVVAIPNACVMLLTVRGVSAAMSCRRETAR